MTVALLLLTALIAASPSRVSSADRMATQAARAGVSSLQVLSADPGAARGRRWVAWTVGRGGGQSAHVALYGSTGARLWSTIRPDAFDPLLTLAPSWTFDGRPVFFLTLSYGAASQAVEVLTLGPTGVPHVTDRRDAALVELRTSASGKTRLFLRQGRTPIPPPFA